MSEQDTLLHRQYISRKASKKWYTNHKNEWNKQRKDRQVEAAAEGLVASSHGYVPRDNSIPKSREHSIMPSSSRTKRSANDNQSRGIDPPASKGQLVTVSRGIGIDPPGTLPIHSAIKQRNWAEAHGLLNFPGIDIEAQTACGATPLLMACQAGNVALIQKLVSLGANPHHRNSSGQSAFDLACNHGHTEIAQYLSVHRNCWCDPNAPGKDGIGPRHSACINDLNSAVRLLLDHGADIHDVGGVHGDTPRLDTPLLIATRNGDRQLVKLLLDRGARLSDRDERGRTALHLAALRRYQNPATRERPTDPSGLQTADSQILTMESREELIQDLLARGADLSVLDNDGKTAFDVDRKQNSEVVVQWMQVYSDRVLALEGRFAAHAILRSNFCVKMDRWQDLDTNIGNVDVGTLKVEHFRALLQTFDEDVLRVKDRNGRLPLHVAAKRGAPVEILNRLMFPCAVNVPDHFGSLPIHYACEAKSPLRTIQYLVRKGGAGMLRKPNMEGCLPLHSILKTESTSHQIPFETIQYLVNAYPESLMLRTRHGDLPITMAGASSSLETIFFLMRQRPENINSAIGLA